MTGIPRMPQYGMATGRTYTAAEINELIEVLRASGDIAPAGIAGMELLGQLLTRLEDLSDADIELEVRRHLRSL